MRDLSRLSLYKQLLEEDVLDYQYALKFNIMLLSRVEDIFLTVDNNNHESKVELSISEIVEIIRSNIDEIRSQENFPINNNDNRTIKNIEKYLDTILSKRNVSVYNVFNKLLSELGDFNEKEVKRESFAIRLSKAKSYEQVFLSYAYEDRLYTAALFEYFLKEGAYLYVDWMHHGKYIDGRKLKRDLQNEISKSNQIILLRTPNSELDIQGKHMMRSWSSWEMGNFYSLKGTGEKYLLNLYSVDNYSNLQLHGLKLFNGIQSRKMVGTVIEP